MGGVETPPPHPSGAKLLNAALGQAHQKHRRTSEIAQKRNNLDKCGSPFISPEKPFWTDVNRNKKGPARRAWFPGPPRVTVARRAPLPQSCKWTPGRLQRLHAQSDQNKGWHANTGARALQSGGVLRHVLSGAAEFTPPKVNRAVACHCCGPPTWTTANGEVRAFTHDVLGETAHGAVKGGAVASADQLPSLTL